MLFPERKRVGGPVQKPLDQSELERIWRWERNMIWFNGGAMVLLIAGIIGFRYFSESALFRYGVLAMIPVLTAIGAYVQFREVCPRCKSLLGRQSRFVLPNACRHCGVEYPRPVVKEDTV
jgi:hypothetical protein